MGYLQLVARDRTERLSNDETVRLGRLLTHRLDLRHVTFPEGTQTTVIELRDCDDLLPEGVATRVREVIGAFDEVLITDP